jgi:hypothetical protein
VTIIRPLALVDEKELARLARIGDLPAHVCPCPHGQTSKRETAAEIIRLARQAGCHDVTTNLLRSSLAGWDPLVGHDNGRDPLAESGNGRDPRIESDEERDPRLQPDHGLEAQ